MRALADAAFAAYGSIDIVFLNAGIGELAEWQGRMARKRAKSLATGSEPDAYLWG